MLLISTTTVVGALVAAAVAVAAVTEAVVITAAMLTTMMTEIHTATCPMAEARPPEFKGQHVGLWVHQAHDLFITGCINLKPPTFKCR